MSDPFFLKGPILGHFQLGSRYRARHGTVLPQTLRAKTATDQNVSE